MKTIINTLIFILIFNYNYAQSEISGIIKNSSYASIDGANVIVKGTNYNTITDANGKFIIDTHGKFPFTLIIAFEGYKTAQLDYNELPKEEILIELTIENQLNDVVITSRRRLEKAQNIPISISVIGGRQAEIAGAFNVNRLKELIPSVQLFSSNPRNTNLNIRGQGSTFGLTNDGIDPGVGFYVDGIYYARPAATTLDFVDVDQIEVLRGPQGSLFGKNTTAGAFKITTRKPSFIPGVVFEASYGNYGYVQSKTSITGPLSKKIAGRLSFSGTKRDGLIENVSTGKYTNELNNLGFRGQLLYNPSETIKITLATDYSTQRPDGYAQVAAGVVETKRAPYRQFNQIIADLNYTLPSLNAFDRKIDHDTPWRSDNDLGGISLNLDAKIGRGTLTSTTAWRFWKWDPSNDRDFTGLQALSKSQNPSSHNQLTQEVRYSAQLNSKLSGVAGVFFIDQEVNTKGTEESGNAQWRFSQDSTSPLWATPGLFEGYGIKTNSGIRSTSAAIFSQIDWQLTERLHILPGLRYNYDKKKSNFDRQTYGGLQTNDPALIALKNKVYTNQTFQTNIDDTNLSGNITLSYKASDKINSYATYAKSYKPVGVNVAGLPTPATGQSLADLAVVKPENVNHIEIGIKTAPFKNSTINISAFNTETKNYQTQVQSAELGINRGYLSNAEKVRVHGAELESRINVSTNFSFNTALSYTEGIYVNFKNAPLPLEETGSAIAFKDISGDKLPGISKWAGSLGGDYSKSGKFYGNIGKYFFAIDAYARSSFSSSPSPSKYLNVAGYGIVNGHIGFRASEGLTFFVWGRNLLNKDYYEQLLPAGGNSGLYAGVLGDQRTYGITLKYVL